MISMPTATFTPCGRLRGAGKPATPAGPKSQSGIGTPGWRTSGVKINGRLSSIVSSLFRSITSQQGAERGQWGQGDRKGRPYNITDLAGQSNRCIVGAGLA